MKTGIIRTAPKATCFNLNAVNEIGSSVSTQVWSDSGSPSEAAKRLLEWDAEGIADRRAGRTWNRPLHAAFIHVTATGETFHYNFEQEADVRALEMMANPQSLSPAS